MRYPNFMLILVLLLLSLAACGQKGPLYLPDQQAADTQQDAEDESAEKKEKK